jgi:hypothetical protein
MQGGNREFIEDRIRDLEASSRRFENEFSGLDAALLDMKPDADQWSINECLDHLVRSNATFHPVLEQAAAGRIPGNFWFRLPFVPAFWGRMILGAVSPRTARKTRTFPVWLPLKSNYGRSVLPDLAAGNEALAGYFRKLEPLDLDKTLITSTGARFVVYNLRALINILTEHEKRHFNQAVRVKARVAGTSAK